jgi:hypothetical protein
MKHPANLSLLHNYLDQPSSTDRSQYAVDTLNRQLSSGEITREDLLYDLGYATVRDEDNGCDAQYLAERTVKDFPPETDDLESYDLIYDSDAIAVGYVEACGDLYLREQRTD